MYGRVKVGVRAGMGVLESKCYKRISEEKNEVYLFGFQ